MMRTIFWILAGIVALIASAAFAQEAQPSSPSAGSIPYRTDATPLQDHGARIGVVLLAFLAISGGALYFIRKKIPSLNLNRIAENDTHLKIIKRARLNPRASLYVVEFNQRKLLIGQSGDHLVCLADTSTQPESQDQPNA